MNPRYDITLSIEAQEAQGGSLLFDESSAGLWLFIGHGTVYGGYEP